MGKVLGFWLLLAVGGPAMAEIDQWIGKNLDKYQKVYQHLHQNPELSFAEQKTAAFLSAELEKLGIEVKKGLGKTGILGLMANGPGKTVMIRTDLDALPVKEETGLAFASQATGKTPDGQIAPVMHACGHDIHMTNLLAVAEYFAGHKKEWQGTLIFVGQPAEEIGAGASAMLKDGLFKIKKPDYALAIHVASDLETGKVGYRAGYALANVDSVDIKIKGKGGHGSAPHTTVDPIAVAAQLIVDLQTIVAREIDPIDPAVVTVGSIHGGTKHNIIPNEVDLQLTVRSYKEEIRKHLLDAIKRKAEAVSRSFRAEPPVVKISQGPSAMFNDEKLTDRLVPVLKKALGDNNVVLSEQGMGGEDFSQYGLAGVPILMYRVGSVKAERLQKYAKSGFNPISLHSAAYFPDAPETLRVGIKSMVAVVTALLPIQKGS